MSTKTSKHGEKTKKLYICLVSVHGLIRGEKLELGRDADTGGQTKYVVELARALSRHPKVGCVDLLTRRILDPAVSDDYAIHREQIEDHAAIIRIPCGPDSYLRKEALWPYLDTFIDRSIHYIRDEQCRIPDVIHGHYADAGLVGSKMANLLGVPFVFTGHSLGRDKNRRLLRNGMSSTEIESEYNISTRINAEEFALSNAARVITSTQQEIDVQYSQYHCYHPAKMRVLPPGINTEKFNHISSALTRSVQGKVARFLTDPEKPMVLAIARADERKNICSLVEAFASSPILNTTANLVIVAGTREDISEMNSGAQKVLKRLLMLIDKFDLYGHVAYPKNVLPSEVPALFSLAAETGGVFVNPALVEPFGLTLIEAAAAGLPIIATNDGGPRDIIGNCHNGKLIDPVDISAIRGAMEEILTDNGMWHRFAVQGKMNLKKHYTWKSHVKRYVKELLPLTERTNKIPLRPFITDRRLIVTDIDNTLIGNTGKLTVLLDKLATARPANIGFAVATGRHIESAVQILRENNVPTPDFYITSVGTEIHYGDTLEPDQGWSRHIGHNWKRQRLEELLTSLPGMKLQAAVNQRRFKLSFEIVDHDAAPKEEDVQRLLRHAGLAANVIYSHNVFVDVIPIRASKGYAVRYMALKRGIAISDVLVAGDSGNDACMLTGETRGVVVGNFSPELNHLKGNDNVYFATDTFAGGIVEGVRHFSFVRNW